MNAAELRKVRRGDIVKCLIRGREFFAHAGSVEKRDGELGVTIDPIPGRGANVSQRWASGADVTQHYKRAL